MKDKKMAMDHLKSHQSYPATKVELVAECNSLSDFSADDKKWFGENLPDKSFSSAEDVMSALGWSKEEMATGAHMQM